MMMMNFKHNMQIRFKKIKELKNQDLNKILMNKSI